MKQEWPLKKTKVFTRLRESTSWVDIWLGVLLSSLFINILSLAFPLFLLQIYDRIIPNAAINTLLLMFAGVLCALILEVVLRMARAWVTSWIDARFEHLSSCQAFRKILNSKITDYELIGSGSYLEHLNSIHVLRDFYSNQVISAAIDLPFIVIFLGVMGYIAGELVFVPIVVLCLLMLATFVLGKHLADCLTKKRALNDRRTNFIISILSSIHSLKAMGLEAPMIRRYERLQEATDYDDYELNLKESLANLLSNTAGQVTTVLIMSLGAYMVLNGQLTVGVLAACVLLGGRILQPVSRLIAVWARMQAVKIAEQRLQEVSSLPQEVNDKMPVMPTIKGDLALKNVSFRYTPEQSWIFSNLHFNAHAGEIVGLRSEGLSGKSSLLWIMMGVVHPQEGQVLIDHKNVVEFDPVSVRQQIAYVPQQTVLFKGNLLDNLTLFRPNLIKRAKQLTEQLGIAEHIQRLPNGYKTLVGRSAVEKLPHGIKQMMGIVRALLLEPRIILFDEANTALDMRTDALLKSVLMQYRGKCTWIVVSHRPSLLELADRKYELIKGNLKEVV